MTDTSSDWQPPPDSGGYLLLRLNTALIVISSVVVFARLIVRGFVLRSLGWDDLVATIGYGLAVTMSGLGIKSVSHGAGTHIADIPIPELLEFFTSLITLQLVFFPSLAAVRFSVMAFYLRLSSERWFRWGLYSLAFVNLAITLVAFFYFLTECGHISDLWYITDPNRQCKPKAQEQLVFWAHGIIGIAIDVGLLILPVGIVLTTMRFSARMVQVLLVFGVGIFAIVAGIVRIYYSMTVDFLNETTHKMLLVGPWTDLELHIGLWVACFPALQPILRFLGHKLGIGSINRNTTNDPTRRCYNSQDAAWKFSEWSGTSRNSRWNAGRLSLSSFVPASRTVTCKRGSKATIENEALEMSGLGVVPGIRKTTVVTIQVAEPSEQSKEMAGKSRRLESWDEAV